MLVKPTSILRLRAGLTRFADSNLLQVRLLHVWKVFNAGDVEPISDAQVELLQLHIAQQLVEPLSVLVHQHDLATLAVERSKVIISKYHSCQEMRLRRLWSSERWDPPNYTSISPICNLWGCHGDLAWEVRGQRSGISCIKPLHYAASKIYFPLRSTVIAAVWVHKRSGEYTWQKFYCNVLFCVKRLFHKNL